MPDTTIKAGGRAIAIRPLTRAEVKALRADGIDLAWLNPAMAEAAVDAVFQTVLTEDDIAYLDGCDNGEALAVFRAITRLTYPPEAEVKN